jgi:hypothetical protein
MKLAAIEAGCGMTHYYEDGPLRDTHSESKVNMWQLHVNAPPQAKKKL